MVAIAAAILRSECIADLNHCWWHRDADRQLHARRDIIYLDWWHLCRRQFDDLHGHTIVHDYLHVSRRQCRRRWQYRFRDNCCNSTRHSRLAASSTDRPLHLNQRRSVDQQDQLERCSGNGVHLVWH